MVVPGPLSSKLPQLDSKDTLKRRIDEAAKYIELDQVSLSPRCGVASSTEGHRLTEEDEMAKLRLVVEVGNQVWGRSAETPSGQNAASPNARLASPR
jgi:5-methyltetrahydropteroyltriglutamate--homocysteine methyltransferase